MVVVCRMRGGEIHMVILYKIPLKTFHSRCCCVDAWYCDNLPPGLLLVEERKGINTICQFFWVSLLELGLGVITALLPESEEVFLSTMVRFRVRVAITQLPKSKDGKIDLGGGWECNDQIWK